jgi:hypothetical protein
MKVTYFRQSRPVLYALAIDESLRQSKFEYHELFQGFVTKMLA